MKKFGLSVALVSGLIAAVIGVAAPAQGGVDHHSWLDQIRPSVTVPQVDTTVRHSR